MDDIRALLDLRRKDIERQLTKELAAPDNWPELSRHARSLLALRELSALFPAPKPPVWVLSVSVALVAIALVALAAALRWPNPTIHIDAKVRSLTIVVPEKGVHPIGPSGDIAVTSITAVTDVPSENLGQQTAAIGSLELRGGAHASISVTEQGCITIALGRGPTARDAKPPSALQFVAQFKEAPGAPPARMVSVPAGGTLSFCPRDYSDYLLFGQISEMELSRLHLDDPTKNQRLRIPSIVSGEMKMPEFSKNRKLGEADNIALSEMTDGWLALFPGKTLGVVFSGKVGRARSFGLSDAQGVDLAPTVLDWIIGSPWITSMFSLVTGLGGLIWSAMRYLGGPARP